MTDEELTPHAPRPTPYAKMDAVVLAGGVAKGELARHGASSTRHGEDVPFPAALIPILSRPMVSYALDALAEAETVGRMALVCTDGCRSQLESAGIPDGVIFAPSREDLLANVEAGLEALADLPAEPAAAGDPDGSSWVLLCPCDVPLIRGFMVDDFVRSALDSEAEFCFPVVARAAYEARFPGSDRTWAKLADGSFTGANLMLATRRFLQASRDQVRRVFAARKNPVQLASIIGLSLVLKYATGHLSIAEIEAKVQRMFSLPARAIHIPHPEMGVDVDKLSDLELVQSQVQDRK